MSEFKPEQEASIYLRHIEGEGTDWTQVKELADKWLDEGYQVQTFYTHPSAEIERLRAERDSLKRQAEHLWKALDERDKKLAEAQALLRKLEHRAVDVVEAIHGMELPGAIPVRVQKLQALLSGMPEHEADDWIAVSDRLPCVNDHVIVATEFFGPGDWRIKVGGLEEDGSWTVFGASWTPSHWQPLPVAPRHSRYRHRPACRG